MTDETTDISTVVAPKPDLDAPPVPAATPATVHAAVPSPTPSPATGATDEGPNANGGSPATPAAGATPEAAAAAPPAPAPHAAPAPHPAPAPHAAPKALNVTAVMPAMAATPAPPGTAARPGAIPPARPRMASVAGARQAPTPLKVSPGANAGSPRPPRVATPSEASDTAHDAHDSPAAPSLGVTQTMAAMSPLAVEAALADLTAWRREAERKLVRLEAELTGLRSGATGTAERSKDPRDPTAALFPEFQVLRDNPSAWSSSPAIESPAVVHPGSHAAHPAATTPALATEPQRVHSIRAPEAPRHQYDLELRPGETIDIPSALNGGRRKAMLGWLFGLLVVAAMTALVVAALASQR